MRGDPKLFDQPGRGGLNLLDSYYELKDWEARDALNVVSTVHGAIRKRTGSSLLGTAGVELTALEALPSIDVLIAASATSMFSVDAAGVVTTVNTGLTSGGRWEFALAAPSGGQGPVYAQDGVNTPQQWTGTGSFAPWTASSGTLPTGKFIRAAQNRVFVANLTSGTADPESTFAFSDIGDPRIWPPENIVILDPNDGGEITGIGTIGQYMLFFKADKAWVVYDLDTGANRKLGEGMGCIAHRTILETPSGTYFLSEDHGVMVTDGSTAKRVSDRVLPLLQEINPAMRDSACAAYFDDHYYLSFSVGGITNDTVLDYDVKLDAWWLHKFGSTEVGMVDFATWAPGGDPRLYGVRSAGVGAVDRLFVPDLYTDHETVYESFWNGPYHTFSNPAVGKRCRAIVYDGRGRSTLLISRNFSHSFTLRKDTTFSTDTGLYGVNDVPPTQFGINDSPTQIFGGAEDVGHAIVPTPGVARAWSLQFGNNTSDFWEIESYVMWMQPKTA